jgi:dynein heavy chain
MVHLSVQDYSEEFKTVYKRSNFSTPKNYLDFISNYISFLKDKRKLMDAMVRRLDGGLVTLKKAAEDTEILSAELAEKNKVIAEKVVEVDALIKDITAKSEVAATQQAAAQAKKTQLDADAIIIAKEEKEAKQALEAAVPALQEAAEALKMVSQAAITEVKNLASPPDAVQQVCTTAWFLWPGSNASNDWPTVKLKLLGDMKLLEGLKTYNVEKTKPD